MSVHNYPQRANVTMISRVAAALTIGALAGASNVNVETVRYYQRRGLLAEPARPLGGHRRYGIDDVKRIRFIKRAQQLGFSLEEISQLLALEKKGGNCRETRGLAEKKLAMIETRIADLSRMQQLLKELVAECAAGGRLRGCAIIAAIAQSR